MYAVIFKATIKTLDDTYSSTASRLRERAIGTYGCLEFTACTEGNQEIAVSYWKTLDQIRAWKQDPEHLAAQTLGRTKWYSSYQVQIAKVEREYTHGVTASGTQPIK